MAYCAMNGVELKIPQRALRPREPAPPPPSVTMSSPLVAKRMLRPRTKAEKSMVGVDVKACLRRVRSLKAEQRKHEATLKVLVEQLKALRPALGAVDPAKTSSEIRKLQKQIDKLLARIKELSALANQLAMDAIKGGASQDDVRAAAGEKTPIERTPVSAPPSAPVIETSTPSVLPDGSVVPGPDAKVTTPETGKPVEPQKEAPPGEKVDAQSADEGTSPLVWGAGLLAAWWIWKKMRTA